MNLLLISVTNGLPAFEEYLGSHPEGTPVSREELRQLTELARKFVGVSEALLVFAQALGGKPQRN